MNYQHLSCLSNLDYLKVIPSYVCNRGCTYCYNVALLQISEHERGQFLRSLANVLGSTRTYFVAEVIGGEPLQHENMVHTLNVLSMLSDSPQCKKCILSTAIGDAKHLSRALPYVDFLYFSMDISHARTNRKRLSKQYLRQLSDLCVQHQTELCISIVMDGSETKNDIADVLNDLLQFGIGNVCFGFTSFFKLDRLSVERYTELFYFIFRAKCVLGSAIRIGGDILESLELHISGKTRSHNCHCGESSLAIQPDGRLSPSICFEDSPHSAIPFDRYLLLKAERDAGLKCGECGNCELWRVCRGGCMGAAVKVSGQFFSRDESTCDILRSTWGRVLADICYTGLVPYSR